MEGLFFSAKTPLVDVELPNYEPFFLKPYLSAGPSVDLMKKARKYFWKSWNLAN
jgi:hypothetical protein